MAHSFEWIIKPHYGYNTYFILKMSAENDVVSHLPLSRVNEAYVCKLGLFLMYSRSSLMVHYIH